MKIILNEDVKREFQDIEYKYYDVGEYKKKCINWIIKNALVERSKGRKLNIYKKLLNEQIELFLKLEKEKNPESVSNEKKRKKLVNKNLNKLKKKLVLNIKKRKPLWRKIQNFCKTLTDEYSEIMIEKKESILNVIPNKLHKELIGNGSMVKEYRKFIIKKRFISKFYNYITKKLEFSFDWLFLSYLKVNYPKLVKKNNVYISGIGTIKLCYDKKNKVIRVIDDIDKDSLEFDKDSKLCSVIYLRMDGEDWSHANSVIIDHKLKKILLIEPHGILNSNKKIEENKRNKIKKTLNLLYSLKNYKFISFKTLIDSNELSEKNIGIQTNLGLCAVYSMFITIYILLNNYSNKSWENLLKNLKQTFKTKKDNNNKLNRYIRRFMYLLYLALKKEDKNLDKKINSKNTSWSKERIRKVY